MVAGQSQRLIAIELLQVLTKVFQSRVHILFGIICIKAEPETGSRYRMHSHQSPVTATAGQHPAVPVVVVSAGFALHYSLGQVGGTP